MYRTDALSLVSIGSGWFRGLTTGGTQAPRRYNHLLDTSPLGSCSAGRSAFDRIRKNVERGLLRGLAISATNYETGTSVTFFDGASEMRAVGAEPADGGEDGHHARPGHGLGVDPHLLSRRCRSGTPGTATAASA